MKRLTLFLLTMLLISSCAKKGNNSNVKLLLGNLVSTGSIAQNGGVYLIGHRLDDYQSIAVGLNIDGSDNFFTLEKGKWEFAAIGWSGNAGTLGGLSGETRCAYSGVKDLALDDEQIELNLTKGGCDFSLPTTGERFSAALDLEADKMFKKVNFYSCMEILTNPISASECIGINNASSQINVGLTKSYQILLPGELETGGVRSFLPGLKSSCMNITDAGQLRLPTGNGKDGFISIVLAAYPEENCLGEANIIDFRNSLRASRTEANKRTLFLPSDYNDSGEVAVYFEHNPNSAVSSQIFGNGQNGFTIPTLNNDSYAYVSTINENTVTVTSGHGAAILPYDEVMLYVSKDNGTCGSGFGQGRFVFSRVAAKGSDTFTFFKSVAESFGGIAPNISSSECDIQIVKVYNFQDLTLYGTTFPAANFDEAEKIGGVLAMRVKGVLTLGSSGSSISSYGAGFTGTASGQVLCSSTLSQCAPFGYGNGSSLAGGGAIYISARTLVTDSVSSNHYIKSEPISGANAGSVLLRVREGSFATSSTVQINGDSDHVNVRYCNDASNSLGNGVVINSIGGIANLTQTSSLCY